MLGFGAKSSAKRSFLTIVGHCPKNGPGDAAELGLGSSGTSRKYAIASLDEARAYLAHPVLGSRLHMCVTALQDLPRADAKAVFENVDALKLRSSLTLFMRADGGKLFEAALQRWFSRQADERTDQLLALGSIGDR